MVVYIARSAVRSGATSEPATVAKTVGPSRWFYVWESTARRNEPLAAGAWSRGWERYHSADITATCFPRTAHFSQD